MRHSPPRPPTRAAIPGRARALAPPCHYYFATPTRRNHFPAFSQKRPPACRTFDFSIPEARLLLTQVPRVAQPQNSPLFPHRFSPRRIFAKWGLTNGLIAVKIDCVHGANHAISHHVCPGSASVRRGSRGTGWDSGGRLRVSPRLDESGRDRGAFEVLERPGASGSPRGGGPARRFGSREGGGRWPGSEARGWEGMDRSTAVVSVWRGGGLLRRDQ